MPCVIIDFSHTGARLETAEAPLLPDSFILIFDEGIARMHCEVRWRNETRLGVEFR